MGTNEYNLKMLSNEELIIWYIVDISNIYPTTTQKDHKKYNSFTYIFLFNTDNT